jgi:prevent-host-death family protein
VRQVNIHEAKTHLSRLVEEAAVGEEIVIAKAGRPIARLVPYVSQRVPRPIGLYDGQPFDIAEDFDRLPEDLAAAFGMTEP